MLSQTYPFFEVHIYDNASTQETENLVKELMAQDQRIFYYRHPKNIGAVKNFAFGLSKVKTPFFSFLSDDDILLPHFYEEALLGFSKYPEAYFSCTPVIETNKNGKIVNVKIQSWPDKELHTPPEGLYEMIPKHLDWMGILFRTELRETIGNIDTEVKAIDFDFLLRCSAQFPYVVSRKPSAIFVQHPASYSQYAGLKVIWPSWQKIIQNIQGDPSLSIELKKQALLLLEKELQKKLFFAFVQGLKRKDISDCKRTASVMKQHGKRALLAQVLYTFAILFRICPFLHGFLKGALFLRRKIKKEKRGLQKRFEMCLK